MTSSDIKLSVLDLIPVRTGQSSRDAMAASMSLAALADELGYHRYWFAEHHNMASVASTTPPVLIAAAASQTERIRLGSGGVMLPNHSAVVVAEQFAALEALYPGRVDLGIGRAPGSDPVITSLLRQSGPTSDVDRFPDHVRTITAAITPEGASIQFTSGGNYELHATPTATTTPEVWLLGSSDYSAQLAAQLGLPYVFANHFAGHGLEHALSLYRTGFQPSEFLDHPRTFVTVNAVASATAEEARERALPQLRAFARLRLNKPMRALETVDEAVTARSDDDVALVADRIGENWLIGTDSEVRTGIEALAQTSDVDEVMIVPMAGSYANEPSDSTPGREQTLRLLHG